MKADKIIKYRGETIYKIGKYYYPAGNMNFESKCLYTVKRYLNRNYIPAMEGIKKLFNQAYN